MISKMIFYLLPILFLSGSCTNRNSSSNTKTSPNTNEFEIITIIPTETYIESIYPITLKGQEDVEIRPRVEGFIEEVLVEEGSVVKKGQTLFTISSPYAEQALRSAKAALNSATAKVNTAQVNIDRIQPLVEKNIISHVQLETAQYEYEAAVASLEQCEAELINAQTTMNWTHVNSPVDGIVGLIKYRKGSLVNSINTLTIVANTEKIYACFSLNEKQLPDFLNQSEGITDNEKLKAIPAVSLVLADGTNYPEKGRIETVSGIVDTYTGAVNIRAEFNNSEGFLKSGTSGNIIIRRLKENAVVIPQEATFRRQNKILVCQLKNDSIFHAHISVMPLPDKTNFIVTEGLYPGDKIIGNGLTRLKNGKPFSN